MAFLNVQKTFNSTGARLERTITVRTNAGYVLIEASLDGIDWQRTDAITQDGGYVLFQGKAEIRVTPIDGAEYEYI